jgi:hypothetical protein
MLASTGSQNTRSFPGEWAQTRSNLGATLNNGAFERKAIRRSGDRAARLSGGGLPWRVGGVRAYEPARRCRNHSNQLWRRAPRTRYSDGRSERDNPARGSSGRVSHRSGIFSRDERPHEWASAKINLGNELQQLGIRTDGDKAIVLLADAVAKSREGAGRGQPLTYDFDVITDSARVWERNWWCVQLRLEFQIKEDPV